MSELHREQQALLNRLDGIQSFTFSHLGISKYAHRDTPTTIWSSTS